MKIRSVLGQGSLWLHILVTAVVFGGSVYESMVINSVWYASPPESLAFMWHPEYSVQPGRFWSYFGPFPFLAALLAMILNLHLPRRRLLTAVAFVCIFVNVVTTVFYFVPILMIIFSAEAAAQHTGEDLARMALNWKAGTWGRMLLLVVSLVLSVVAVGLPAAKQKVETNVNA